MVLSGIFWTTFVLSLIACIVLIIVSYSLSRKFYPLFYILSIFTYINFVAFTIDAFNLNKNIILALLSVSAVIFISLGFFFARIRREKQASLPVSRRR